MEKYYFNKEIAYPFNLVYRVGYEAEKIEDYDFLKDLFDSLLLELNGRINGANYLSDNMKVGDQIDLELIEEEDISIFNDEYTEEINFNEECQLIAVKRLKALQTFRDSIEILYRMFYNADVKDLEKLVKENARR